MRRTWILGLLLACTAPASAADAPEYESLLKKAADFDADIFIGGHGDVSNRADVLEYAQMHTDFLAAVKAGMAKGLNREELADTVTMPQYKHFRNYHRMRGWVYALHHLLTTGKPMAPFP